MKININNLSSLSKLNKNDFILKVLKININLLLKNLFIIKFKNIKPITNPLNNKFFLKLRKDKRKKNKLLKSYILSAPIKKNNYIIIPNIL